MLLVLIGSDLHMMEALERYDRPLHGRVRPFVVEPLNPAEVSTMTNTDPASALDAYCMLGGFPQTGGDVAPRRHRTPVLEARARRPHLTPGRHR